MLNPISTERLKWVDERMKVVQATIEELTAKQAAYVGALTSGPDALRQVHINLRAELLQLAVERTVLDREFKSRAGVGDAL
jgi:chemotaxis response regulator CheB